MKKYKYMIQNFTITKLDNKGNEKAPTRSLSTNLGTKEKPLWTTIGKGWVKTDVKGNQYVSVQLEKTRQYESDEGVKTVEGYVIVKEKEYNDLVEFYKQNFKAKIGNTDVVYPDEDINPENIPF